MQQNNKIQKVDLLARLQWLRSFENFMRVHWDYQEKRHEKPEDILMMLDEVSQNLLGMPYQQWVEIARNFKV